MQEKVLILSSGDRKFRSQTLGKNGFDLWVGGVVCALLVNHSDTSQSWNL